MTDPQKILDRLGPSARLAMTPGTEGIFLSTIDELKSRGLVESTGGLGWEWTETGKAVRAILGKEQSA